MLSTRIDEENLSLQAAFLSDIELYFSPKVSEKKIFIEGEELHHIKHVLRHKPGDKIFVTDGMGQIYKTEIAVFSTNDLTCRILQRMEYPNRFPGITFCIPRLKSAERFEFALEKSVELGITNLIVFDSQRTIAKGEKLKRWQKILISAMKQSLRAWLPKISYKESLQEILTLDGKKILLDQKSALSFSTLLSTIKDQLTTCNFLFIFGHEGGFTNEELSTLPAVEGKECKIENEVIKVRLTENRLRSETAVFAAASLIGNLQ